MNKLSIGLGLSLVSVLILVTLYITNVNQKIGELSMEMNALNKSTAKDNPVSVSSDMNDIPADNEERLNNIEQGLQTLVKNIDALTDKIANLKQEPVTAVDKTTSPDPQPRTTEDTQMLLEQAMTASTETDPVWSTDTVTKIDRVMVERPELSIAHSVNTNCTAENCKITAILPKKDADKADLFHITLLQSLAADLPRAMTRTDTLADGSIQYTVYMARSGYRLPTEGGGLMEPEQPEQSGQ
jgi:hypothetical protein